MKSKSENTSPIKQHPLRLPGEGLDSRLRDLVLDDALNYFLPAVIAWGVALGCAIQAAFGRNWILQMFVVIAGALTIWAGFGFRRVVRDGKYLKLGRQGERLVGQLLQTLDIPGSRVFHDIPAESFNLDHVVVCDRGIYVVETKTWSKRGNAKLEVKDGRILMNGRPVRGNPVGQVASAAKWLSEMLAAETGHMYGCQAVVAIPGWFIGSMDPSTKAVAWVLEPKALLKWIPRDTVKLQIEDIRRIEGAIARHVRRGIDP